MNRRELLKSLLLAYAGLTLPSSLFAGCGEKDSDFETTPSGRFDGSVLIIGAGAAGMYAAHLFHQRGNPVRILEASGRYGGRVRPLSGFSDFSIELGAEEIHGNFSDLYNLVLIAQKQFVTAATTDYLMLDDVLKSLSVASNDIDVIAAEQFVASLENYTGSDISILERVFQLNINQRVHHYINALAGNENGASINKMGTASYAAQQRAWSSGNTSYTLKNGTLLEVLEKSFPAIPGKVQLNTPVTQIDYSGTQVKVTSASGEVFYADKVIVTVPVAVLRQSSINFSPVLPADKLTAIQAIETEPGMKIILKFSSRFWDAQTGSIYGTGYVPEFWSTGTGRSTENNVLTAFICGENASFLSSLSPQIAVQTVTAELDRMYGTGVASGKLVNSHIIDWTKEPYIRGAYSYAGKNTADKRAALAATVNNKLYFAGEATHTGGHFGTVHGALETAMRVYKEIMG